MNSRTRSRKNSAFIIILPTTLYQFCSLCRGLLSGDKFNAVRRHNKQVAHGVGTWVAGCQRFGVIGLQVERVSQVSGVQDEPTQAVQRSRATAQPGPVAHEMRAVGVVGWQQLAAGRIEEALRPEDFRIVPEVAVVVHGPEVHHDDGARWQAVSGDGRVF
jgi:hypothetical protein